MRMREAIKEGKSFLTWLATQHPKPTKTDIAILQLRFEEMSDALNQPPPSGAKRKDGQFIVVSTRNNAPAKQHQNPFIIHSTEKAATDFVINSGNYEYGCFKILPYLIWHNTFIARVLMRKQKLLAIMQTPKLSIKTKPKKKKPNNKALQDSMQNLNVQKTKLGIKGDTLGAARIENEINKLKAKLK